MASMAALAGRLLVLLAVLHLVPHGTTTPRWRASASASAHLTSSSDGRQTEGPNGGRLGAMDLSEGNPGGPAPRHDHGNRNLDVRVEFIDEFATAQGVDVDDGRLFEEPPRMTNPVPEKWVQRCSRFNGSDFEHGAHCGGPPSAPCLERSRCHAEGGPKIYVYDQEVCCFFVFGIP